MSKTINREDDYLEYMELCEKYAHPIRDIDNVEWSDHFNRLKHIDFSVEKNNKKRL